MLGVIFGSAIEESGQWDVSCDRERVRVVSEHLIRLES